MVKEFCPNNDLLRKLKSRGMIIKNPTKTKRLLEYGNYFVIINGYKELFIDPTYTGPDERYKMGTTFEELYAMYEFDRDLRALYLRNILIVEHAVKSILSRVFSAKYGHDNYLRINNFDTTPTPRRNQTREERVGAIVKLISTIQSDISQQLNKQNPMISHYQLEHGYIPPWVLVNILSLGTISLFYSFMYQSDQNDIGRKFGLKPHEMQSLLSVLTLFRNTCAHGGRFYNYYTRKRIVRMPIHTTLGIPLAGPSGNLSYGQKDVFAATIIFRTMLKKKEYKGFFLELDALITKLGNQLHTISINDVLRTMGFPPNWKDLRR